MTQTLTAVVVVCYSRVTSRIIGCLTFRFNITARSPVFDIFLARSCWAQQARGDTAAALYLAGAFASPRHILLIVCGPACGARHVGEEPGWRWRTDEPFKPGRYGETGGVVAVGVDRWRRTLNPDGTRGWGDLRRRGCQTRRTYSFIGARLRLLQTCGTLFAGARISSTLFRRV